MLKQVIQSLAIATALSATLANAAEIYPTRAIKLVVPYAAGGAVDRLARLVAQELNTSLGQPVIVDNRPGAATAIGASAVIQSDADGYSLLVGTDTTMALNPLLFKKLSYDPSKLQPIALLGMQPMLLVSPPQIPAASLKDLISYAKSNPGKLNYVSLGSGSVAHLMGEKFRVAANVDIVGVPYKGGAPAVSDLISNQVQLYFDGISNSLPQVNGGSLKTFGTTGSKRSAIAPNIPTLAEQGFPSMTTYFWIGLFAPTGTPAPIVERLNAAVRTILAKPEVIKRLDNDGVETTILSEKDFGKLVEDSLESWRKVVTPLNLTLD